jgi:hypothetical protein
MESVIHSLVESMPSKISKATLSQTAVANGILTDRVRILRLIAYMSGVAHAPG